MKELSDTQRKKLPKRKESRRNIAAALLDHKPTAVAILLSLFDFEATRFFELVEFSSSFFVYLFRDQLAGRRCSLLDLYSLPLSGSAPLR